MNRFKLSSLFRSQRGFSLTEIMVGGGILAGVALASAQMFKDQKSAQKKVEHDQKLAVYHQGLTKVMNMAANCNATFKAHSLANAGIPANFQFNNLTLCGSNCEDTNENGTGPATKDRLNHKASDVAVGAAILTRGQYTDTERVWLVEDIRHGSATVRTTSGPVVLKVTYRLNPNGSAGTQGKVITKDLIVHTRFNNNQLQECVNGAESSINNLQNDFCKSLNYQGVNTSGTLQNNGQFATWDEATQTCIFGTSKNCNMPGYTLDGVDSLGNLHCKPLQRADDGVYLQDTGASAVSCAAPRLEYNAGTGKMRLVCP